MLQRLFCAAVLLVAVSGEATEENGVLILNEKNFTRSSIVQQRQMLAVQALGSLGSDDAKGILKKYEKSWHLPANVKKSIKSTLSQRS